ncbi:MAG: DUF6702 family protein [Chitinophagaceae bacterium]
MIALLLKGWILLLASTGWFVDHLPAFTFDAGVNRHHPFFVSVTELNHNQAENTLEISCKMFADDFENALKAKHKTGVDITHPKDPRQADKLVFEYIQKHLQIKVNEKPVNLEYIGFEKESEAVWCYMQVKDISRIRKLEIMNNLLYEMYNTQIGIIHASAGGQRKSTRLNFPDTSATFQW